MIKVFTRRESATLTEQQSDVLRWLTRDEWKRPMDIGGASGSHHHDTLRTLIRKGLVERRRRGSLANMPIKGPRGHTLGSRGSFVYRTTMKGERVKGSR